MFLDGTPHWNAVQMDGTALPILLTDQMRRESALDGYDQAPMIQPAVRYLLKHGPYTEQDRWEEIPGYSPYTTATEVAALLAAADFIEKDGGAGAQFLRETADAWQEDGYGETAEGEPYKKHGIGRGWPLLAGERAHYEIAAGRRDVALELLKTMARQTSECGMLPEQVWDASDIPEHMLFNGRPAGSGMPLVWAHAEYSKLLRSLHTNTIWNLPPQTVQRYQVEKRTSSVTVRVVPAET